MVGWAVGDEELGEQHQHVVAIEPPGNQDRQTFATELVDHHQHSKRATVMRALLNEVIGPDMMPPAWPKPDAGTVVEPEPTTLGLLRRHLQPFLAPDPRHALGIHMPALGSKQGRDPAIAVTTKLTGKIDDRFGEPLNALSRSTSSGTLATCRWVERACPRTWQARRSETPSVSWT